MIRSLCRPLVTQLVGPGKDGVRLDATAINYFSRVASAGGTLPPAGYSEAFTKRAISDCISELKATPGLWELSEDVALLDCVGNWTSSSVKIKDGTGGVTPRLLLEAGAPPALTASGVNMGLRGDGTSTRVSTGYTFTGTTGSVIAVLSKETAQQGIGDRLGTDAGTGTQASISREQSGIPLQAFSFPRGRASIMAFTVSGGLVTNYLNGMRVTATPAAATWAGGVMKLFSNRSSVGQNRYTSMGLGAYIMSSGVFSEAQVLAATKALDRLRNKFAAGFDGCWEFWGDSITRGVGPTDQYNGGWTTKLCVLKGVVERNYGIGDSRVRINDAVNQLSFWNRRSHIGDLTAKKFLCMYPTNDVTLDAVNGSNGADFQAKDLDCLDAAIAARGAGNVVWLSSPGRRSDSSRLALDIDYNGRRASNAALRGVQSIDVRSYLLANGGDSNFVDEVHQTDLGTTNIANYVASLVS